MTTRRLPCPPPPNHYNYFSLLQGDGYMNLQERNSFSDGNSKLERGFWAYLYKKSSQIEVNRTIFTPGSAMSQSALLNA
jgi:hypothetical protein